jgi:hypothetical protein
MNKIGPPLKLWFYTIGIVVFILLSFMVYSYSPNSPYKQQFKKTQNRLKQAIIKNNTSSPLNNSIVFIGSSLTGCAFESNIELEKKITRKKNKEFHVLKITISGLNNEIAQEIRFFDYISKYPPTYLFIENNNLNIDSENNDDIFFHLKQSLENITSYTKNTIGVDTDINFNAKPPLESEFYKDKFNNAIYSQLLIKKRFVRTFLQNKTANKAYAELIKKNTKIIFLDMPRASKLESVYLNKKQKMELNDLLESYQQIFGIEYWKYSYNMNDSDFSDGGHLNYKGAKKYSEWFITKFDSLK